MRESEILGGLSDVERDWFDQYGIWVIFVAGFSPIPYKVFTIAAGVAALNLPGFILASIIGRGARFFLVAGPASGAVRYEEQIQRNIERLAGLVVVISRRNRYRWFMVTWMMRAQLYPLLVSRCAGGRARDTLDHSRDEARRRSGETLFSIAWRYGKDADRSGALESARRRFVDSSRAR